VNYKPLSEIPARPPLPASPPQCGADWSVAGGEEDIAKKIVDSAFTVHKKLGPGLLEKVYEICFCHELSKRGLKYQRQVYVPIIYDGIIFNEGLRLDVLVEEHVICELLHKESL